MNQGPSKAKDATKRRFTAYSKIMGAYLSCPDANEGLAAAITRDGDSYRSESSNSTSLELSSSLTQRSSFQMRRNCYSCISMQGRHAEGWMKNPFKTRFVAFLSNCQSTMTGVFFPAKRRFSLETETGRRADFFLTVDRQCDNNQEAG
jgi:hypothetical protein